MVQVLERELPFGKLAENFGRSLGETIGPEVKRQQTVSGIKNIAEQFKGKPVGQLDLVTQLLGVPGLAPETLNTFLPILTSAIRAQSAGQPQGDLSGLSSQLSALQPGQQPSFQGAPGQQNQAFDGVTSPEEITSLSEPGDVETLLQQPLVLSNAQKAQEASKRFQQNPGLYPTFETALESVNQDIDAQNTQINARKTAAQTRQNLSEQVNTSLEKNISQLLQRAGLTDAFAEIPGTVQRKLLNNALTKVKSGKTVENATLEESKEALKFARINKNFKETGDRGIFGPGSPNFLKDLANFRDIYDKFDAQPEYFSELKKKDLGDFTAATLAYPPSKEVETELKRLAPFIKQVDVEKKIFKNNRFGISEIDKFVQSITVPKEESRKVSRSIFEKIQPNDSIFTIVGALDDAGITDDIAYDEVRKLVEQGKITLSDRQEQELAQALPVRPTLNDLLGFSGLTDQGKFGFWEAAKRLKGKR